MKTITLVLSILATLISNIAIYNLGLIALLVKVRTNVSEAEIKISEKYLDECDYDGPISSSSMVCM